MHGSFSEGVGSIDSHSFEASDLGLDAIWWSDHDFRIASYQLVTRFGFEDRTEALLRNEDWGVRLPRQSGGVKELVAVSAPGVVAEGTFVTAPVREGERSFAVRSTAEGAAFVPALWVFESANSLHHRALAAQVVVNLAVYVEELGPDARGVVQVRLSEHAPREGLPLTHYTLRYELTEEPGPPVRDGSVYRVPLAYQRGGWNEYALPLTADAVRGFPFLAGSAGIGAEDNSLFRLWVGVETRRGASASVAFDDLRIDEELRGEDAFARQRALLDEVGARYPGLTQLQGVEISYASRHLNEFSEGTRLLDYDAIAAELRAEAGGAEPEPVAFRERVLERAVAEAHARGGLISYNHLFGVSWRASGSRRSREDVLARLLSTRADGADLLEVGYRARGGASLADHLWVWDRAALAGLRLVGIGVSDSHGGDDARWRGSPNNFVSWVYAVRPDKPSLIAGLRAGRAFFGDLERFDGTLDLVDARGWRMGQTVVTDRAECAVEARVTGLGRGVVVLVQDGAERGRVAIHGPEATGRFTVPLVADADGLVRVELFDAEDEVVALGNPIWFLRSVPEEGLEGAFGVDVAGVRVVEAEGFRLERVERGEGRLALAGRGAEGMQGRLVLELGESELESVELVGLAGRVEREGERVTCAGLEGSGQVLLGR